MTRILSSRAAKRFSCLAAVVAAASVALAVAPVEAAPPKPTEPAAVAAPAAGAGVLDGLALPVSASQNGPWTVNVGNFPAAPTPRLWQGTPYVGTRLLLHVGLERCEEFPPVPAGQVLFLQRATATIDVRPGRSGAADLRFTLPGGALQSVRIPAPATAPILQADGNHDGYSGTLELGIPVTSASACFHGDDVIGQMAVIGYLVPAA